MSEEKQAQIAAHCRDAQLLLYSVNRAAAAGDMKRVDTLSAALLLELERAITLCDWQPRLAKALEPKLTTEEIER